MRGTGWVWLSLPVIVGSAFYLPMQTWQWSSLGIFVVSFAPAVANARRGRRKLVRQPWQQWPKPFVRGVTDNHGHAKLMSWAHARRLFPKPSPHYGAKILGIGQDGKLLYDRCNKVNGISLEFAGSGGFKSQSSIATDIYWHGSSVIHDPSEEHLAQTWEAMVASGKPVYALTPDPDPRDPQTGEPTPWAHLCAQMNPLDGIDILDPLASMWIRTVTSHIFGDRPPASNGTSDFFFNQGKDLVSCLIAHILWSEGKSLDDGEGGTIPPLPANLATVRQLISLPGEDLQGVLRDIYHHSPSGMARHLAGPLSGMKARETFDGIHGEAHRATSWLTNDAFSDLVCGESFRTSDIVNRRMSVFVQIPLDALENEPAVGRVIIGAFFAALVRAKGRGRQKMVLFQIDEARFLGRMRVLEIIASAGRKYRAAIHLAWQSVGQMEDIWGPNGRKAWFDAARYRIYSSVRDGDVAKSVSDAAGGLGVMAYSEGQNDGQQISGGIGFARASRSWGRVQNAHEISRQLIKPDEVTTDLKPEWSLVLGLENPLIVKKALWWQIPSLRDKVRNSPFYEAEEA